VLEIAAARSADTRLGIALLGLVLFGAVATTRANGRISVVPMLVLCLIVAGWLFGATLVWGTGYATKIRWSASWTYNGDAWQWTALLVIALIGVGCLGLGVRADGRCLLSRVRHSSRGALSFAIPPPVPSSPASLVRWLLRAWSADQFRRQVAESLTSNVSEQPSRCSCWRS